MSSPVLTMSGPALWIAFGGLFVLAGLLNLARGRTGPPARRPVRRLLALSCFAWGAAAVLFRFAGQGTGYAAAVVAGIVMLGAALQSVRSA